ncbi:MAG: replication protein RepA [Porticoccaceae bacterium]
MMEPITKARLTELRPGIIADQGMPLGLPYATLCMTALPYREHPLQRPWLRQYAVSTMTIEPGYLSTLQTSHSSRHQPCGIPFGARARILLLYFQREILRSGQREVERNDSFRQWLQALGISAGGKTYRAFRQQEIRIFTCRLSFTFQGERSMGAFNEIIVEGGVSALRADSDRFDYETIIVGQSFFDSVQNHPVPVADEAIRSLAREPFALDLYCWLAAHLHRLDGPVTFAWPALHNYFGVAYAQPRHFRMRFLAALKSAVDNYPRAAIQVDDTAGVTLYPSPPPR